MIRLLQVAVVLFWLATTGWLLRSSWFPDESRFVTVEPREVLDAMFINWNETAELVVLGEGRRVGQMSISASSGDAGTESGPGAPGRRSFSSTGSLDQFGPGGDEVGDESGATADGQSILLHNDQLFWRGHLDLDDRYQFAGFDVALRFPQQRARIELAYQRESTRLHARVDVNGATMVKFDGTLAELSNAPAGGVAPATMPLPMSTTVLGMLGEEVGPWLSTLGLSAAEGELPAVSDIRARLAEAGLVMTTKYGRTTVVGRRMAVYLISIGTGNPESTLKVYISEDGRPVKIDAPFDFLALAELLAPEYWREETEPAAEPK